MKLTRFLDESQICHICIMCRARINLETESVEMESQNTAF